MSKLPFIVGPTAVGKSEVAFQLAQRINGELISCDAMQVYREINIASAKPTVEMLEKVPHHLINVVSVEDEFDVVKFRRMAIEVMEDILSRGKQPIFVGGSGMYVMALLDGIFEGGERDDQLRQRFEKLAELEGLPALHKRLQEVDLKAAKKIDPHDQRRIVRALEVYALTGKQISELQEQRQGLCDEHEVQLFFLNRDRQEVYDRVNQRVDEMFDQGIVEEIKNVLSKKISTTVARMISIPEIKGYLDGEYDLDRAKYLLKMNTRHFVKRQLTWFRKEERLQLIDVDESDVSEKIRNLINVA